MNVPMSLIRRTKGYIISHYSSWRYVSHSYIHQKPQRCRLLSSNASIFDSTTADQQHTNYSNDGSFSFESGPLHDRYYELVSSDTIDPIQIRTLQSLERLRYELSQHPPPSIDSPTSPTTMTMTQNNTLQNSLSKFTNWFGLPVPPSSCTIKPSSLYIPPPKIKGVYIHGGVGCGKTFLMNDIFYASLDDSNDTPWSSHRQKIHFHTFMLQVHQQMHMARQKIQQQHYSIHGNTHHHYPHDKTNSISGDTMFNSVVSNIVQKGRLICFDEFQVTDVADALLLQRLFTSLWKYDCIVVATSNRPPDDLYLHGLQRDRFLPFIEQLKVYCQSVGMWESEHDYRLVLKQQDDADAVMDNNIHTTASNYPNEPNPTTSAKGSTIGRLRVYFMGEKEAWKIFDRLFYRLVGKNKAVSPTTLQTQGRLLHIPQSSLSKGMCRFTFESLCTKAMGAADYLVLGQHFHTVFVDYIPVLKLEHINWVRRFIIFVDTMYECNCKLILHAKTEPKNIFQTGLTEDETATTQIDEVFAFQRTVSRLHEMSSQTYLQKQQKLHPITIDDDDIDSTGRVESKAALLSHRKAFVNFTPS